MTAENQQECAETVKDCCEHSLPIVPGSSWKINYFESDDILARDWAIA
jgi:hypothetical protein